MMIQLWPFVHLAGKRVRTHPALFLLLALNLALAVGLAVCIPVFTNAAALRVMQEELAERTERPQYAPLSVQFQARPNGERPMTLADVERYRTRIGEELTRRTGLPLTLVRIEVESDMALLQPPANNEVYGNANLGTTRIVYAQGVEQHSRIVAGEPWGATAAEADVLPVWVEQQAAEQQGFQVGERYELVDAKGVLKLQLMGFWQATDPDEAFWEVEPTFAFRERMLTSRAAFETLVSPRLQGFTSLATWHYVLDSRSANLARTPRYLHALDTLTQEIEAALPNGALAGAPLRELEQAHDRRVSLSLILAGFSLPLAGILAYLIVSVAHQLTQAQAREAAMLLSRGSSRGQILALAGMEAGALVLCAGPLGVLAGIGLARLLGFSLGFLALATPVPLELQWTAIDPRAVLLVLAAGALARLLPVWFSIPESIVIQERQQSRWRYALGPLRLLLGGFLSVATVYSYRKLAQLGAVDLLNWWSNAKVSDPLPALSPLLFLFAAPLGVVELFNLCAYPLSYLARGLPSVAAYLSGTLLSRESWRYRAPLYVLVLSLSVGIFYASLAVSSDQWLVERRRYEVGADLTFTVEAPVGMEAETRPISEYEALPGVRGAMPVGQYEAVNRIGAPIRNLRLMGIDRLRFPQVAYYRRDYAPETLGTLMNRLAATPEGVLLPSALAAQFQLGEGDRFPVDLVVESGRYPLQLQIVGTFDYFPTEYDKTPLALVNLDYLQTQVGGGLPYGIWLRLERGADPLQVLDAAGLEKWVAEKARNLRALVIEDQRRLERVGVLGMLSVCYFAGALLSGLGFMLCSLAAITARKGRFAVLQALGMSKRQILGVVVLEYSALLLYGVLAGTATGLLASNLYVPLWRLASNPGAPVPPFIPYIAWDKAILLAGVMAAGLVVVELILLLRLRRARVFELLRLGGRE